MNTADLIVILILSGIVFLAVRSLVRQRRNGFGCSGSCAGCMQKCSTPETASGLEKLVRRKRAEKIERNGSDPGS